jgi:chromosome segregation ATPase
MKKSSSITIQRSTPRRRGSSASQISIDEFSQFSHQLFLLSEELKTLKNEKDALNEYNQQLQKKINECKTDNQLLSSNHEKLHNETRNINKFTYRFEQERAKYMKNVKESHEDIFLLDQDIENLKINREELENILKKETKTVFRLQDVIGKMRNELNFQEKDRDRLKNETATTQKQIRQIEEKVEMLQTSNTTFMKKIKKSILDNN